MAKWIWLSEKRYPQYQQSPVSVNLEYDAVKFHYCVAEFEKVFSYEKEISSVDLRVSADAQFRLWMNGELVGIGPAHSGGDFLTEQALPWHYANNYKMDTKGNALCFFAQVQLLPQVLTEFSQGHGGFYLEGTVTFADGSSTGICTDESWNVRRNGRFCAAKQYDETIMPDEWYAAEEVAQHWPLEDAPIPMLSLERILPQDKEQHCLAVSGGDTITVLFDRIYTAYLGVKASGPCKIGLEYFEIEDRKGNREEIALTGPGEFFTLRLHSVGGMRVHVYEAEEQVSVEPFLLFTHYPIEQEAQLQTSDVQMDKVFDVCKWTLNICRQTMHLDSPSHQELLACSGDYYIESMMTPFTFGDMRLAALDVRRTAKWLEINDGRMFHTNYSLIWVQWLWFVYWYTGERQLLIDCQKALQLLLERFHGYLGDNGVLEHAPDYMFVDWVVTEGYSMHHPPKALGQTVLNAFYYKALTTAVDIAKEIRTSYDVWEQRATELKVHFQEYFYDKELELYIDGLDTPGGGTRWQPENPKMRHISRYANTLAVLYELCPKAERARILSVVADPDTDLPHVQPYFMHFVLQAVWKEGLFGTYGFKILDLWKDVVRVCDKGLQEGWITPEPGYRFDYSHAWGGTPAYHIPLALTGFEMLEPGYQRIALSPKLWGLEHADVSIPTPYGEIRCVMQEGKEPIVTVPDELKERCILKEKEEHE